MVVYLSAVSEGDINHHWPRAGEWVMSRDDWDLVIPKPVQHEGWIVIGEVAVDSGCVHIGDIDCGPQFPFGDDGWSTDGHGTVVRTLEGDGQYQVWAQLSEDGDVERILVEFDTGFWDAVNQ